MVTASDLSLSVQRVLPEVGYGHDLGSREHRVRDAGSEHRVTDSTRHDMDIRGRHPEVTWIRLFMPLLGPPTPSACCPKLPTTGLSWLTPAILLSTHYHDKQTKPRLTQVETSPVVQLGRMQRLHGGVGYPVVFSFPGERGRIPRRTRSVLLSCNRPSPGWQEAAFHGMLPGHRAVLMEELGNLASLLRPQSRYPSLCDDLILASFSHCPLVTP